MSKELFIVIILFSIFILGIILTIVLYNNRINKKVKNYINDKKGRPGVPVPPLIYVMGIFAICALVVSSIVYLIPQRKLYDVEYVLYTHPASITIGLKDEELSLERLMKTVLYHAEDVSNSNKCSVYFKESDSKIKVIREDGVLLDIIIPNIVIAFNDYEETDDVKQEDNDGYKSNYVEYKEYKVSFDKENNKVVLSAVLYQDGDSFIWGPKNSSEFSINVINSYQDFETKYEEFLLTDENIFEYQLVKEKIEK